jgi:hypothetical protein
MKKLLGVDIVGSATLSPGIGGVGTVTFTGPVLGLHQLLIVTNVTRNTIIYNFADPDAGEAAYSNNVLTLTANTATQSASDVLQVFVDVAEGDFPTPVADSEGRNTLARILQMLMAPLGYDKSLQRQRVTGVIESGTVTTVTGVTTVTTVTGVTNIDGRNGAMLINQTNLDAWASCVRARIT